MRYQRAELPLQLNGLAAARKFFAGCLADGDPTRLRALKWSPKYSLDTGLEQTVQWWQRRLSYA